MQEIGGDVWSEMTLLTQRPSTNHIWLSSAHRVARCKLPVAKGGASHIIDGSRSDIDPLSTRFLISSRRVAKSSK